MQKLKVFHYATSLDLSVGYYKIKHLPCIQDMKTTVTGFGKSRYIWIPMGICALGYILQAKVDEIKSNI